PEDMRRARMHTAKSGCGDARVSTREEGVEFAQRYLSYFPASFVDDPPDAVPGTPASTPPIREIIPVDENKPFDMHQLIDALIDEDSFLEIHARWAREVIVGYGRLDGHVVGIVANQPKVKGGGLFVDSSAKCARFIWTRN